MEGRKEGSSKVLFSPYNIFTPIPLTQLSVFLIAVAFNPYHYCHRSHGGSTNLL